MINGYFQDANFIYEDLREIKQDTLMYGLSHLFRMIKYAIKSFQEKAIKIGSSFLNQSLKLVALAVTGIKLTLMKVEKFIAYISQINLSFIHIAPQINIHRVVNYYKCPNCAHQEKENRLPLGLAY